MRFYVLLGLGAAACIAGAAILIMSFQLSQMVGSGEVQLYALQKGIIISPDKIMQGRTNAMNGMIGGAALVIVGIALTIIAIVTKPKT